MIGTVRRTWPDVTRTTIIVTETETGKDFLCYVFLPEGQWIAALCEQAWENGHPERATPLVFTLDPKSRWGYKIVGCELLPEMRNRLVPDPAVAFMDALEHPVTRTADDDYPSTSDLETQLNQVLGKQWHDI